MAAPTIEEVEAAAEVMVNDYAPLAPEAVRKIAIARLAAYIAPSEKRFQRSTPATAMVASGAASLLSSWVEYVPDYASEEADDTGVTPTVDDYLIRIRKPT